MLNLIKRLIYRLWFSIETRLPFQRGKHRISLMLTKIFGSASYKVGSIEMKLNPHEFFWRNLMKGSLTDKDVEAAIRMHLEEGDIFIDIGANLGYFSLIAAVELKANVFSFEPSSREIKRLIKNISLNQVEKKIVVCPFGISDHSQQIPLNISPLAHPGMNSVVDLSDIANVASQEAAQFHSLGGVLSDGIIGETKVCKIDVGRL